MSQSTFERVSQWNERCGKIPAEKGTKEYWEALENQLERIQEELDETKKAVQERDLVEVLDGGCDLDVTVSGFNFLTDLPYEKAIKRVLDNNDEKYSKNHNEVLMSSLGYKYNEVNVITVTVDDETFYSLHRQVDDKILKLLNHPRVDLSDLV